MIVPLLIGLLVAALVAAYATMTSLGRSRAFYPTVLIVVAHYYVLFAVLGESQQALVAELLVMAVFVAMATVGHARSLRLVVLGLAAHGVMDAFHGLVIENPGVPTWWPPFCLGFDVAAALALWLVQANEGRRRAATPAPG